MITKDITIEDLVEDYPFSVKYLADKGIRCIKCGEPIWGTLEEACREKKFDDTQIEIFLKELNSLKDEKSIDNSETNAIPDIHIKKI
jgi:methionine synthase II (cobalamin-independent)